MAGQYFPQFLELLSPPNIPDLAMAFDFMKLQGMLFLRFTVTPLNLIQAVEENRAVESLKSNGLIEKIGSNKSGHWKVNDQPL